MFNSSASNSIKEPVDVLDSGSLNNNKLNCQKYDETSARCVTCFNGYQLLSTGACSIMGSNIITDPYCTAVT